MRRLVTFVFILCLLAPTVTAAETPTAGSCINVEKASAKKLQSLDGIGPKIAKAIIDYRKKERTAATKEGRKTWNFRNWKTLMKVKGVGKKTCEKLREKICFGAKVQKSCPK